MRDLHRTIMLRSIPLWVASFLCMAINLVAASVGSLPVIFFALACAGACALYGIAFGVWAGRKLAKA